MGLNHLQLTFAIIKPHVLKNPEAFNEIKNIIVTSNFKIVRSKIKLITLQEACNFYSDHQEKFFYKRLVTFMTSGPSALYILARENAISYWRTLMGPTKTFRAQYEAQHTIRGRFGLSDTRNATHGSDSDESVRKEIRIFFPDFNCDRWYEEEEKIFRRDQLVFSFEQFLHTKAVT